jgi:hypothetical protein
VSLVFGSTGTNNIDASLFKMKLIIHVIIILITIKRIISHIYKSSFFISVFFQQSEKTKLWFLNPISHYKKQVEVLPLKENIYICADYIFRGIWACFVIGFGVIVEKNCYSVSSDILDSDTVCFIRDYKGFGGTYCLHIRGRTSVVT